VRTTIAIERLVPGRTYDAGGAAVTADAEGRALVEIELDRRRELRIS
jgi:hypothetical protein